MPGRKPMVELELCLDHPPVPIQRLPEEEELRIRANEVFGGKELFIPEFHYYPGSFSYWVWKGGLSAKCLSAEPS